MVATGVTLFSFPKVSGGSPLLPAALSGKDMDIFEDPGSESALTLTSPQLKLNATDKTSVTNLVTFISSILKMDS